jgi:hypothetical protein
MLDALATCPKLDEVTAESGMAAMLNHSLTTELRARSIGPIHHGRLGFDLDRPPASLDRANHDTGDDGAARVGHATEIEAVVAWP